MIRVKLSTSAFSSSFVDLFKKVGIETNKKYNVYASYNPMDLDYDLLVLSGGEDISPAIYGDENVASSTNEKRDIIDIVNLAIALSNKKKIFGVCRGHQLINGYLGGKLIQDLEHPLAHSLEIITQGIISFTETNSLHHQGVSIPGNKMVSVAMHKNIHEVTVSDNMQILSIQGHPEFNFPNKDVFIKDFARWINF